MCVRTYLHVHVSDPAVSLSLCESVHSEVFVVPYYNLLSACTVIFHVVSMCIFIMISYMPYAYQVFIYYI